jgi:hypothetical protein
MTCNCIGGNPCPCQRGGMLMGRVEFAPVPGFPMMPQGLQELLEKAKLHVMTPKEKYEQRISWIQGMSGRLDDPMPSRESIVKMLEENGIYDPDKIGTTPNTVYNRKDQS